METGLRNARVLVTGASRGIGRAAAAAFLAEGARVVLNSSNRERLTAAVADLESRGEVHPVVADLRAEAEIDRLVREAVAALGGLDVLVYVTGSPRPGRAMEPSYADWLEASRLLLVSPAYLARRVAEGMIASGTAGRLVFSGSVSMREPIPTLATSNVARISLLGLVRTLARELGPRGLRVNGVLPGYIRTERIDEITADAARRNGTDPKAELRALEAQVPLGRLGEPEELARVFLFLASPLSSYVSGAVVPVDGALLRSVG